MSTVISVEHLSKSYRLGAIGGGTLREDLSRWWARMRQKPDPNLKIGEEHHARHIGQEFWALQDVSFEVKEGEILGIIGRNGAGKSTLLKILSRVTGPTSGYVKIKGRIASLLEVGTGFHPELTGRENIFLNGTILGMTKAEIRKKFDEIVDFSGIEEFIDTPVKRYSSGMYVRLAFAVAAHLEPEILIIDEVLAVGDVEFQKKCLGKMQDISKNQGRTILFVSHNISAVVALCTSGFLLVDGSADTRGHVDDVVARYLRMTQQKAARSIKELRRDQYGAELSITTISLLGGADQLNFGHDLAFELRINSKQTFENLSIGCSIFHDDETCIGTTFTAATFDIARGENKRLRLTLKDTNLAPGSYYAGFSVGQGGLSSPRHDYDIVVGMPSFQITTAKDSSHQIFSWSRNWGGIFFKDEHLSLLEER